jgi:hypothetical protein
VIKNGKRTKKSKRLFKKIPSGIKRKSITNTVSSDNRTSNSKGEIMICPYYSRTALGTFRCEGSTLSGFCGYPERTCPMKQKQEQERRVDYVWYLTKKDWEHIISLLQFDYFKGNKQSEKLFYKLVELRQQAGEP